MRRNEFRNARRHEETTNEPEDEPGVAPGKRTLTSLLRVGRARAKHPAPRPASAGKIAPSYFVRSKPRGRGSGRRSGPQETAHRRLGRGAEGQGGVPGGEPLPKTLARGIVELSGVDVSDVVVHRDSHLPASLGAEAYTEGRHVHLGPGADEHLPHEAWHAAQQKQGRVTATSKRRGLAVNDDPALEREADVMGDRAARGAADPVRTPPARAVEVATAGATSAVLQGKFTEVALAERIDEETEEVREREFIDEATGRNYRLLSEDGELLILERDDAEERVVVDSQNMQAVAWNPRLPDDDDTTSQHGSDPMDLDEPGRFERVKAPVQPPPFVKPRDPEGRAAGKDKKPSAFTVGIFLEPAEGVDRNKERFFAEELEVVDAKVSNERPPTRFQNRQGEGEEPPKKRSRKRAKQGQRSHTTAFGLIREALGAFAGRPLPYLLDFLARGVRDLVSAEETEPAARQLATKLAPRDPSPGSRAAAGESDMDVEEPPHIFIFESLLASGGADARARGERRVALPLDVWTDIASKGLSNYEIAHHKSAAAAFADGPAKGHGEPHALAALRAAEQALRDDSGLDIYVFYKANCPNRSPEADAIKLLDQKFSPSLPWPQWRRAVSYWLEMLYVAFPAVMRSSAGASIRDTFLGKELPPGVKKDTGRSTRRELLGDVKLPGADIPKQRGPGRFDVGGMNKTELAAHVRIRPRGSGPAAATGAREDAGRTRDELAVGAIQLGEHRPPTRYPDNKQRSHTVAWTLVRASIQSFGGQPLADLHEFLAHAFKEMVGDLDEEAAYEARRVAAIFRAIADEPMPLGEWQHVTANGIVEYLRLHQLCKSSVYNKDPGGRAEPHAMQVLEENEAHVRAYGGLYDDPAEVVKWAQYLLDADFHPDLPWRQLAKAVLHWEEALWNAFPSVMAAGAARITGRGQAALGVRKDEEPAYSRTLERSDAWGHDLPVAFPDGRPIATVGDLVEYYLDGAAHPDFGAWKSSASPEDVDAHGPGQVGAPAPRLETEGTFTSGGRRHVAWSTQGDGNCAFNGLAIALMGATAQGRMSLDDLAARSGIARDELEALTEDARSAQTEPDARRRIEDALADPLRKLAVEAIRGRHDLRAQMREEFMAELRGRIAGALGIPWQSFSDMFGGSALDAELAQRSRAAAEELGQRADQEESGEGSRSLEERVDAWMAEKGDEIESWFDDAGIAAYLAGMSEDRAYAGALELHALAGRLGVALVTFKDQGGGVITRDEGSGNAGSAPRDTLEDGDIEELRRLDLIEGGKPAADCQRVYFRFRSGDEVDRALEGNGGLAARFRPLWEREYLHREEPPLHLGVYRHRERAHWSAVSTAGGAYDLNDPADYLEGRAVADRPVDGGAASGDLGWRVDVSEGGPAASDAKGKSSGTARVTFQRNAVNVPGVETSYPDHMFGKGGGKSGFDLSAIDKKLPGSDRVALVNAANASLRGGGGIDGAIREEEGDKFDPSTHSVRRARDVDIDAWQRRTGRKSAGVGDALTTSGGALGAKGVSGVIHTVGPQKGATDPMGDLRRCVENVLEEAAANNLNAIVFCNISSAIFGLPPEETATTIRDEVERVLQSPPASWKGWIPKKIYFNNFPPHTPAATAQPQRGDGEEATGAEDGLEGPQEREQRLERKRSHAELDNS